MNNEKSITIVELLQLGKLFLKNNGIVTHHTDAEILLMYLLNIDKVTLFTSNDIVTQSQEDEYMKLIKIRSTNKPVSYITNKSFFMDYEFYVNENVLIPRGDTQFLVNEALRIIHQNKLTSFIDLCTGSGIIPISISLNSHCNGIGIDICPKALEVAMINVKHFNLENKIGLVVSDLFENIPTQTVDIIISNPPYINKNDMNDLMADVKNYEPHIALYGGLDGLSFYKSIITKSKIFLNNQGYLVFEIGYDQGLSVKKILENEHFTNIKIIKDYNNLNRVVSAKYIRKEV